MRVVHNNREYSVDQLVFSGGCSYRARMWDSKVNSVPRDKTNQFISMLSSYWARTGTMPLLGFATSRIAMLTRKINRDEEGERLLSIYNMFRDSEFLAEDCIYRLPLPNGIVVGRWDLVARINNKVACVLFCPQHISPLTYTNRSILPAISVAALLDSRVICKTTIISGQYQLVSDIIDTSRVEDATHVVSNLIELVSRDRPMYSPLCNNCEFSNICGGNK